MVMNAPMDSSYEALVDRAVALKNELCENHVDLNREPADRALAAKYREFAQVGGEVMLRGKAISDESTRDADDPNLRLKGMRTMMDYGRIGTSCSGSF